MSVNIIVNDKTIEMPKTPYIVQGDKASVEFLFKITNSSYDISNCTFYLKFRTSQNTSELQLLGTDQGQIAGTIEIPWIPNVNFTSVRGYTDIQLMAKTGDTVVWNSKHASVLIYDDILSNSSGPVNPETPALFIYYMNQMEAKVALAQGYAQSASSSATSAATSAEEAQEAQEAIENMTVSSETLEAGEEATVTKTEVAGVVNLEFGLPQGADGESGVYYGTTEPENTDRIWIDPSGEAETYLTTDDVKNNLTSTDIDKPLSAYMGKTLQDNKVDKVTGKGLSTNDFTTEEKNKLQGIESGAEVNVQSDWNESDSTKDSYILNKPSIPTVPTKLSEFTDDLGSTPVHTHSQYLTEHQSLSAYRTSAAQDVIDATKADASDVEAIEEKIPSQATSSNQLADKSFVNSSIATETAHYISNQGEPFTSVAQLEAYTGTVTNNDYAFVTGTDESGNTYYDRYKATVNGSTVTWAKEYRLNNSSFTAAQWSAISSGITSVLVASYNSHIADTTIHVTSSDKTTWNGKYTKPATGIPDSDLEEAHYTETEADAKFVEKVTGKGLSTNDYDNTEKGLVASALQPSDVVNDLTTGGTTVPLSAEQGKTLKNDITTLDNASEKTANRVSSFQVTPDNSHYPTEKLVKDNLDSLNSSITTHTGDSTIHVTSSDKSNWNSKSDKPVTGSITLSYSSWGGTSSPFYQTVSITGVTANSKIDLQADVYTLAKMSSDGTNAIYIDNNNGTLTAYAVGSKPTVNLAVQYTKTEVTQ